MFGDGWLDFTLYPISNGGWFWILSVGIQTNSIYKKERFGFMLQLGVFIDENSVDSVIIAHIFIYLTLKLLMVMA